MAIVGVNVSVANVGRFKGAIDEAEKLGLKVEQTSIVLLTANGLIDEDALDELRKVAGLTVEGDAVIPVVVNEHVHGHAVDEGADKQAKDPA